MRFLRFLEVVFSDNDPQQVTFGDRLVLGMLGRGFQPSLDRHGNLRRASRRLLVVAFHRLWRRPLRWRGKMIAPERILQGQASSIARLYQAEDDYRPFQFRW